MKRGASMCVAAVFCGLLLTGVAGAAAEAVTHGDFMLSPSEDGASEPFLFQVSSARQPLPSKPLTNTIIVKQRTRRTSSRAPPECREVQPGMASPRPVCRPAG
jgi:hypothetical protein